MPGATAIVREGRRRGLDVKIDKKRTPYDYYIEDKKCEFNPIVKTDREGAAVFVFYGVDDFLHHCDMLGVEPVFLYKTRKV